MVKNWTFTILETYIQNIKNMNNASNNDSLSNLEHVISMIGDDMKHLYLGVRENWWKLRQVIIVSEIPQTSPSVLFSGEDGLSADDNFPFIAFNKMSSTFYVWNPQNKKWELFSNVKPLKEFSGNTIKLCQDNKVYTQEIKKECKIKFDLSDLDSENKMHEFKLILKISSPNVSFEKNIIWDKDEIPSLEIGKSYIIDVLIIDGTILAKVWLKSSKV